MKVTYKVRKKFVRLTAWGLLGNMLLNLLTPTIAWALTGGPSQPEVQSFTPAGTAEMVDLFSGDFNYNIPLLDVGGYPINLSYNSGVTMDQEASWAGLGWNVNLGTINRSVRGIPDDFKGDPVSKTFNLKRNDTYGVSGGVSLEFFGLKTDDFNASLGVGLSYNNYNGYGFDVNVRPSITVGNPAKSPLVAGLGLSAGSESGVGISPSVSYEVKSKEKETQDSRVVGNIGVGASFNSRAGLRALTVSGNGGSQSVKMTNTKEGGAYLSMSNNGGSSISFANTTYTPQISSPMTSVGLNFSATLGAELIGAHGNLNLSGYYSTQFLATKHNTLPAFGYLHAQEAESNFSQRALLDFNREKDGGFTKTTPNLPLTNFTYDIYSVAGQGVGGMYRPFRGDIGTVYDSYTTTTGSSTDLPGLEFGGGNAVHIGANFTVVTNDGHSGRWVRNNKAGKALSFRKSSEQLDKEYESVYFKQAGEKTAESDEALFNSTGGFDPVRVALGSAFQGEAKAELVREKLDNTATTLPMSDDFNQRTERQPRNQAISYLNGEEASRMALEPTIRSYTIGQFGMDDQGRYNSITEIDRAASHPAHHVSEMSVLRPDGVRYIYGIPTYNHLQQEVSFAVGSKNANCATGLVSYTEKEASTNNESGLDHYYDKVETPAHATAYLLTAIISPDYVDLTGDGPSEDDYGSYTKINYSQSTDDYQWRVPYQQDRANYSEGLKSDKQDQKGSYLYGKKDLWYVHSMETKTHVAEFHVSDRQDGYGVVGERGGAKLGAETAQTMQKLDKIVLYAKPDRQHRQAAAEPIKTVHFRYDYSLCPAVPNNINTIQSTSKKSTGKLTLKEVYFTYGKSVRGKLSPYRFRYENDNPSYNLKGYDRWGNFKASEQGRSCGTLEKTTAEFPYAIQDKALADRNATAWHLTQIGLPSGGTIDVDFESDDYAYVQDREAMQMFTVTATGANADASPTSGEGSTAALMDKDHNNYLYLFFRLQENVTAASRSEADYLVKKRYVRDIKDDNLYFKFFTDLSGQSDYEFVPGYTKIEDAGAAKASGNTYTHGYIKLKAVDLRTNGGGDEVNPISKSAWQFLRLYRPRLAYGNDEPSGNAVVDILKAIYTTGEQIVQFAEGFNRSLRNDHYGKTFVKNKSMIRLYNPTHTKYGGGSRVKQVAMSDAWGDMSSDPDEQNFAYGQVYDYTTSIRDEDGAERMISSGVAAYEPILGGEENPFRQPVAFGENRFLAPSDKYYMEEPFGEMFFPGASVGYSNVMVRNIQHADVKRHATGSTVHEFYTAKDFPTITRRTKLDAKHYNPNPLLQLLKVDVREYMTASQGYAIELNDMHGKPKAQWVYAEDQAEPISGMEYHYQTDAKNPKRLNNTVTTISKHTGAAGTRIQQQNVGVDFDMVADMREQSNLTVASGMEGNLDAFLAIIAPVTVPMVFPKFSQEEVRFRSAVTTKVIQRYGLIDRVVAHDLGASVTTSNRLYDAETGEVLLTETQNQFDDPIFSFTYPAHWGYEGMGMAYQNIGLTLTDVQAGSISNAQSYFVPGDELIMHQQDEIFRAWVTQVNANSIVLKDRAGELISGPIDYLKVIRSGRRNQQTTPIGSVTSLQNPLQDTNGDQTADALLFQEVLNAEAIEFNDWWKQFCQCGFDPDETFNEYFRGKRGNWRAKRSYLYLTAREQNRRNDNPSVREDGSYQMFNPFWRPTGSQGDWQKNPAGWTSTSAVTTYSPYGFELENRDALGRYSSAVYGYNNTLPTAVANNARYRETAFDGFEDYNFGDCDEDHFSYRIDKENISDQESHSGRRSIKVAAGESISVGKVIIACEEEQE